jgi:hypothetical protein
MMNDDDDNNNNLQEFISMSFSCDFAFNGIDIGASLWGKKNLFSKPPVLNPSFTFHH